VIAGWLLKNPGEDNRWFAAPANMPVPRVLALTTASIYLKFIPVT